MPLFSLAMGMTVLAIMWLWVRMYRLNSPDFYQNLLDLYSKEEIWCLWTSVSYILLYCRDA